MPSKNCIHSREDIDSILRFADSFGLHLLPDRLKYEDVRPWKPEEFQPFEGGTIYLFRPEWIVDSLRLMYVEEGVNTGTYVVTGKNFSPIKLYFQGDEMVVNTRRLGDCIVSFKRDFLHEQSHEMRLSSPDVEVVYKEICKHLLSRITVSGAGHRYHVCKEAAKLATLMSTRPPFDYIPWPPPDLDKLGKQ